MQLIFLVPSNANAWSSTLLRGNQLCDISRRYLGDKFECKALRMPLSGKRYPKRAFTTGHQLAWMATCPRDAIYFVTKQCMERLHPVSIEVLRWRSRGVLFDYLDADLESVSMRGAGIHVCASKAQYQYMERTQRPSNSGSVAFLPDGYDCRLPRCAPTTGPVRTAYWGASKNTYIPEAINNKIYSIDGTAEPTTDTLNRLSKYRLHYCVRKPCVDIGKTIFKPLTKAANAAACGANIIINRDAYDAVDLLGTDYPYFVDANDDIDIYNVLESAIHGTDSPEWLKARNIMNSLAAQLSPESIARQLDTILQPLVE